MKKSLKFTAAAAMIGLMALQQQAAAVAIKSSCIQRSSKIRCNQLC